MNWYYVLAGIITALLFTLWLTSCAPKAHPGKRAVPSPRIGKIAPATPSPSVPQNTPPTPTPTPTPPPTPVPATPPVGVPVVIPGGVLAPLTISQVQVALHLPVTGHWDAATRAAVLAYQTAQHISVDGWVGPITWGHLNPTTAHPATHAVHLPPTPPAVYTPSPPQHPTYPLLGTGCVSAINYIQSLPPPIYGVQCFPHAPQTIPGCVDAVHRAYGPNATSVGCTVGGPGGGTVYIDSLCAVPTTYLNEANNVNTFTGRPHQPLDPYGASLCP